MSYFSQKYFPTDYFSNKYWSLLLRYALSLSDSSHSQYSDVITLEGIYNLVIGSSNHSQYSDRLILYSLMRCPNTISRRVVEVESDDRILTYINDRLVMK